MAGTVLTKVPRSPVLESEDQSSNLNLPLAKGDPAGRSNVFFLSLSSDICKRGITLPTGPGFWRRLNQRLHGTGVALSEDSEARRAGGAPVAGFDLGTVWIRLNDSVVNESVWLFVSWATFSPPFISMSRTVLGGRNW